MQDRVPLTQLGLLIATAIVAAVTFIGPPFPKELWLQHVPTAAILLLMWHAARRRWLSTPAFGCVILFLLLHIIGARWIYSFVPYDRWAETLLGLSLSDAFGWKRNHFDRLVHFMSGVLFVLPFAEVLQRLSPMPRWLTLILAIQLVIALGAIYEIIEWLLAVAMSPTRAEAYNGQQGDIWDPQKDLLLALIGALLAGVALGTIQRNRTSLRQQTRQ